MFLATEWEMFYTCAAGAPEDGYLVDQVSIDEVNKRYILDINAIDLITDGVDEKGNEINSLYVSRLVFDIIIAGLEQRGFKRATSA